MLSNAPQARITAPAASASITFVANNASAGQVQQANAQTASVAVTANNATVTIKTNAVTAPLTVTAQQASASSNAVVFANAQTANIGVTANAVAPKVGSAATLAQVTVSSQQPTTRVVAVLGLATIGVGAQGAVVVTSRIAAAQTANIGMVANDPTLSIAVMPITALLFVLAQTPDADVPAVWGTIMRVFRSTPTMSGVQASRPDISAVNVAGASMDEVADRRSPEIMGT